MKCRISHPTVKSKLASGYFGHMRLRGLYELAFDSPNSAMGHVKRHGGSRRPDVQHRHQPLQLVMSGLVEDVADPDHASGLTRKVHCQPGRTATEYAGYGIQFLTAGAQVIPGYDEVGGAEGGARRKQNAILAVPESLMTRGLNRVCRLHYRLH